jgi:hypothetical protein
MNVVNAKSIMSKTPYKILIVTLFIFVVSSLQILGLSFVVLLQDVTLNGALRTAQINYTIFGNLNALTVPYVCIFSEALLSFTT